MRNVQFRILRDVFIFHSSFQITVYNSSPFPKEKKRKIPPLSLLLQSALGNTLWCSVAVIPLPQAAAVAAEGPCPALLGGSFPPHVSPQRPGQLPGQAEC